MMEELNRLIQAQHVNTNQTITSNFNNDALNINDKQVESHAE